MFSTLFIYVTVINFSPAFTDSEKVSRTKRSDGFVPCEKGWYHFREKCYRVGGRKVSERLIWEKAAAKCKNLGGDLVTIQSQEEQDFIVSFLLLDLKLFAWIGLNDRDNESDYRWSDGSIFNYTNWNKLEPTGIKDENEDCVQMLFEPENDIIGKWNDKSCNVVEPYICQMNTNKKKKSPNKMYCSSDQGGGWKFQNTCYHVVTEMKSWQSAEKHCKDNYNGHLVTILDVTTDIFLDYILANIKKELWIGIKIQDQLQQKWTSGWFVSYDGFHKEQGNFIDGTCVLRKQRKEWIMISCSKKYSFICETSEAIPPVLNLPAKDAHCPEELEDWRDLGGEHCYYIETAKSHNWYEASFNCKSRGGDLVSLHSKEESDILHPFVRYTQKSILIGLFRLMAYEDQFAWSDGSEISFKNWKHDEPNNEEEKCVEVKTNDMTWNDCACEDKAGYICSIKKTSNSTVLEDTDSCSGHVPLKVLIGVSFCIILVMFLLGVLVFYFRPCDFEHRKNSTGLSTAPPPSPSKNRTRYRSATELTLKEDEYYEMMM